MHIQHRLVLHILNHTLRARPSFPPATIAYIRNSVRGTAPLNVVECALVPYPRLPTAIADPLCSPGSAPAQASSPARCSRTPTGRTRSRSCARSSRARACARSSTRRPSTSACRASRARSTAPPSRTGGRTSSSSHRCVFPTPPEQTRAGTCVRQAFHWCPDYDKASREFARILKPDGVVALIWNLEDRYVVPFHSAAANTS